MAPPVGIPLGPDPGLVHATVASVVAPGQGLGELRPELVQGLGRDESELVDRSDDGVSPCSVRYGARLFARQKRPSFKRPSRPSISACRAAPATRS